MKRIEFIAPVEAMRGNLSGNQDLVYPTNDNKAFDAPEGKRSYARNYQPRFIGAKIASTGKKYFAVKTKSAVGLTSGLKLRMAILGGFGAIYGAIMSKAANTNLRRDLLAAYGQYYDRDNSIGTFHKWLSGYLMPMLQAKAGQSVSIRLVVAGAAIQYIKVGNPWVGATESEVTAVTIDNDMLVKFWPQLANNPIVFKVGDLTGVAHSGDSWQNIMDGSYNVLGMAPDEIADKYYVMIGDEYLQNFDPTATPVAYTYCETDQNVQASSSTNEYRLIETAPGA